MLEVEPTEQRSHRPIKLPKRPRGRKVTWKTKRTRAMVTTKKY